MRNIAILRFGPVFGPISALTATEERSESGSTWKLTIHQRAVITTVEVYG